MATAAAFLAAMLAVRLAARTWRLEADRDLRRDLREQQAQAERVAAWMMPLDTAVWNGRVELGGLDVHVRNASELPVVDVVLAFTAHVVADHGHASYELGRSTQRVLPPKNEPVTLKVISPVREKVQSLLDEGHSPDQIAVVVGIAFTDTGGRHWIRESSGRLLTAPEGLRPRGQPFAP